MKNKKVTSVNVETGDSNDTQTEIKSGINEGDIVVTGVSNLRTNGTTTSPFGAFGGRGFGGGFGGGRGARRD